MNNFKGDNRKE